MANPTTDELKAKATEMGIVLDGTEKYADLKEKIANFVPAPEVTNTDLEDGNIAGGEESEDLEAGEAELKGKLDSTKKAALENKGINPDEIHTGPNGERLYTAADLEKVVTAIMNKNKAAEKTEADVEEIQYSELRVPRYNNKFIVALKQQTMDDFFESEKCFSIDIWDEKNKVMVPTVTAIFEDGTELTAPLKRIVEIAGKYAVACKIVETKDYDKSYSLGKVEQVVYKDDSYRPEATGIKVQQKVTQKRYEYVVEIPAIGGASSRQILVQPEVVNW